MKTPKAGNRAKKTRMERLSKVLIKIPILIHYPLKRHIRN